MNVARHISTQAPVRCWWRSFFGTGWVAFLPLAFVLVLVVLVVLVAVLMALWIASPVWHLELLQRTPCTGHGAPGIFADEASRGQTPIKAACPSSPRTPLDVWGIFESLTGRKETVHGPAPALPCPPKGSRDLLLARLAVSAL